MSGGIVLGIDTSNYTTSLAVLTESGELLANIKRPLPVKDGERGLRQSDAVFHHTKNLPSAFSEAESVINGKKILAIGVSERPRNIDGSYMPCFLAGVSSATAASVALGVPLYRFSHQCGHIMAAIYSCGKKELLDGNFAAFHVSGGTTDLLTITPAENGFFANRVGGTADLNAGQVVDRIGVAMGLRFPCGPELEELALSYAGKNQHKPISRKGLSINLSGLENMTLKLLKDTNDKSAAASFVFDYLGRAISELSEAYVREYGNTHFVYAGGVMCNSIIKKMLSKRFDCSFAEPSMSADNAVGIASLALRAYNK